MDKVFERSIGKSDIHIKNNSLKKLYQSGCSKILNPKSLTFEFLLVK